jgi:hypothetical protein
VVEVLEVVSFSCTTPDWVVDEFATLITPPAVTLILDPTETTPVVDVVATSTLTSGF